MIKRILIILVSLVAFVVLAFKLSPYPTIWVVRYAFNKEAIKVNKALEKYVPEKIETITDLNYDENDKDAYLDVYFHKEWAQSGKKLPVIVWTHGGGLVSGDKSQVSNYCKILASKGFVVVSIDYTIAPEAKFPTPVQQLNKALKFLSDQADQFHADNTFFVLAGDSAGSMISATTANVITSPEYARLINIPPGLRPDQIRGLLLYCGIYDITNLNTDGDFGFFLEAAAWSYFGKKDISQDQEAKISSVTDFLTESFPPTFISAGNNDPLLAQSQLLAQKLSALNVPIDTLFFSKDHSPALNHEYQFNLDSDGKLALDRSMIFIDSLKK
ncbi:alpha/beta hydrolase [Aquiflexum gelatinilyticum]|uniref:alpha/beta hydrolase n=1 Tax=Aquiflexum gelatinilyticum TaxID=2961943 RepID=UPI002169BB55|nr:alpha/beta hydrolase [Aquiflexum gelatinilyticum]MCS4434205.1 alpha/beta hydrolase [Aquiflexum gelatinilyticum]